MSKSSRQRRQRQRAAQTRYIQNMLPVPQEKIVSEIIGRVSSPFRRTLTLATKSVDETAPDYPFWSYLRRGKQRGYQIGALFTKRICEVDAEWTLGRGFTVETGNDKTDELVSDFLHEHLTTIMQCRKDASALGDAYVIVNADASLTMVNPDTVEVITDPFDYTNVIEYKVTTTLNTVRIVDEYFIDRRVVTTYDSGKAAVTETFLNLLGYMPVIHLANDKEVNEMYGHPIYEGLLTLFARYDDVIQKSLDGVEVMGRPIPVATGMKDPTIAKKENSTRTEVVYDSDGSADTVDVVDFEDLTMLWLGEGADFKFASPNSFSADSVAMLKMLFYLMLEHIGIPEWAWGGAISSSHASVDAQMPAFIRYLEGRRLQIQSFICCLLCTWLAAKALTEPVAVVDESDMDIDWPQLDKKDENLLLEKIKYADATGKITAETALRLMDLVEDPTAEIKAAEAEAATDEANMQAELDSMMKQGGNKAISDRYASAQPANGQAQPPAKQAA